MGVVETYRQLISENRLHEAIKELDRLIEATPDDDALLFCPRKS